MHLLLPPSETKRDGGRDDAALDLAALSFPELTRQRRSALAGLRSLSRSISASYAGLGLGPTQRFEVDRNRAISTAPVMPAIERYTGVLYDGLDAASLPPAARAFCDEHVLVQSALFGVIRASDPIPAYRLSHDSKLPGLSLRRHWRQPSTVVLGTLPGLLIDLRSESYATLGDTPDGAVYLRVVSETAGGRRVALSHFNKSAKGEFVRAVCLAGVEHDTVESLLAWGASVGIRLEVGAPGELELVT